MQTRFPKAEPTQRVRFGLALYLCAAVTTLSPALSARSPTGLIDNARISADFSARGLHSAGQAWSLHAVGLDLHTVVSGERGDIGTLTVQPYLLRIANEPSRPAIFEEDRDHALQWRITNFNYTGIAQGRFNIRLGHFEVPFGLEHVIQTNGTLNQMNSPRAIGLKADWGYSINGELPGFEYELAFLRGGGNDWATSANGYFAGRIGLPRQGDWWIAASALDGEMETTAGPVDRTRLGIDAGYRLPGGMHAMLEFATGDDEGRDQRHGMLELGYTSRNESTLTYFQYRHSQQGDDDAEERSRQSTLGVLFEPSTRWSASFEFRYQHDVERKPATYIAQLRLRT